MEAILEEENAELEARLLLAERDVRAAELEARLLLAERDVRAPAVYYPPSNYWSDNWMTS